MIAKRTEKMNGSKPLGSLVRFELDWFFNLFFVLKSIYLTFLQYSILTYINNYMLTYPFVLSSNKRCTLYKKEFKKKKKPTGVQFTPVIGLSVGAMILLLLVIIFNNSFGIKVFTFHLYHL